jgi:hypothetical protein
MEADWKLYEYVLSILIPNAVKYTLEANIYIFTELV